MFRLFFRLRNSRSKKQIIRKNGTRKLLANVSNIEIVIMRSVYGILYILLDREVGRFFEALSIWTWRMYSGRNGHLEMYIKEDGYETQ